MIHPIPILFPEELFNSFVLYRLLYEDDFLCYNPNIFTHDSIKNILF